MTVTIEETAVAPLKAGDRVKVADEAFSTEGFRATVQGQEGNLDFIASAGWYVITDEGRGSYVAPKYLTKVLRSDELQAEINRLQAEVTRLTAERDAKATALTAFQDSTRDALISAAESAEGVYGSGAPEPFDELLNALNLDPRDRDFDIRVDFDGSFYVTISATSLDAAVESVDSDYVREYVSNNLYGDWLDDVRADEN